MKQRSAFTLVELLTTMTMGSSIMLLAIGLVHQSMSMSKLAKNRWEHDQTLARLGQQFRSDVHSAEEVISSSPESLTLKFPDSSVVTYKRGVASLSWENINPDSKVARDLFRFSEGCVAEFSNLTDPDCVVLQVKRQLESTEYSRPVDLRIVAVAGRWQQLARVGGSP